MLIIGLFHRVTPVKSDLRSSSHLSGSLEDMVPRSTPAPLLTKVRRRSFTPEILLVVDVIIK